MSTPFLNDALVRSALTRKIAALEASTQRNSSQPQVDQLNDLTKTYNGILATPNMQPETALGVLSKIALPSPEQPTQTGDGSTDASWQDAFQDFDQKCNQLFNMLSTYSVNRRLSAPTH